MDDFRSQLVALIDAMRAEGVEPAFLIIELAGADSIRAVRGSEGLDNFRDAAIKAVASAASGAEAFTFGDDRVVVILGREFDRLRTFALIEKLRRTIPFLGQSFGCFLRPEFDVVEYDEQTGIGGLIKRLSQPRLSPDELTA